MPSAISGRPRATYWNNITTPYMVEFFNDDRPAWQRGRVSEHQRPGLGSEEEPGSHDYPGVRASDDVGSGRPLRLACLAASPVHYQAPLYRRIAAAPGIDFEAIFASDEGVRPHDGGFGQPIAWDEDLLGGYRSRFVRKAHSNRLAEGPLSLCDIDVFQVVRRRKYDVLWLHGYHTVTHLLASLAQRSVGGALLFREEQTLLHKRSVGKAAIKSVLLPHYFRGAGGLYISQHNRVWFERNGFTPDRLFFMPYCVDNERLRAQAQLLRNRKQVLVSAFGLPADRPVVLTVCRLIEKKQVERLIDALSLVRGQHDCSLLIVGSGPEQARLQTMVDRLRLSDVVFAGFMNQSAIGKAYAAADVFVLPSKMNETFGLVVNEAMNFRLPIIVSDKVGCGPDLVRAGDNGYVFNWDSSTQLADRLRDLVSSQELRARMGQRSEEIVADWNYDAALGGLTKALAWVRQGRRSTPGATNSR